MLYYGIAWITFMHIVLYHSYASHDSLSPKEHLYRNHQTPILIECADFNDFRLEIFDQVTRLV